MYIAPYYESREVSVNTDPDTYDEFVTITHGDAILDLRPKEALDLAIELIMAAKSVKEEC